MGDAATFQTGGVGFLRPSGAVEALNLDARASGLRIDPGCDRDLEQFQRTPVRCCVERHRVKAADGVVASGLERDIVTDVGAHQKSPIVPTEFDVGAEVGAVGESAVAILDESDPEAPVGPFGNPAVDHDAVEARDVPGGTVGGVNLRCDE